MVNGTVVDTFNFSTGLNVLAPLSSLQIVAVATSGFTGTKFSSGFHADDPNLGAVINFTATWDEVDYGNEVAEEMGAGNHFYLQKMMNYRNRVFSDGSDVIFQTQNALDNFYPYNRTLNANGLYEVDTGKPYIRQCQDTPWQNMLPDTSSKWVTNFLILDIFTAVQCFWADEYENMPSIAVPLNQGQWYWEGIGLGRSVLGPWSDSIFSGSTSVNVPSQPANDLNLHRWTQKILNSQIP